MILPTQTIVNHDSQVLISKPDLFLWFAYIWPQVLSVDSGTFVHAVFLAHSVTSDTLLHWTHLRRHPPYQAEGHRCLFPVPVMP